MYQLILGGGYPAATQRTCPSMGPTWEMMTGLPCKGKETEGFNETERERERETLGNMHINVTYCSL